MAVTLNNGTTTLTLSDDLMWSDEFGWSKVESKNSYSIFGALLRDMGSKLSGRPMTLVGGETFGWMSYSLMQTLQTWAETPSLVMTLSFRGQNYSVVFDHTKVPVEATPIVDYSLPIAGDRYIPTIRLLQKAA